MFKKSFIEAARYLVEKGQSVSEIKEKLEDMVKHLCTIIFTPNLNHLKKGGRITPAVAMLGNMLKLVPVMELNSELGGKIDTLGKVRTTRKACKMLKFMKNLMNDRFQGSMNDAISFM